MEHRALCAQAASQEQSAGIEQINREMEEVTSADASQSEELSSTASLLSSQAVRLEELVAQFTLGEGLVA